MLGHSGERFIDVSMVNFDFRQKSVCLIQYLSQQKIANNKD